MKNIFIGLGFTGGLVVVILGIYISQQHTSPKQPVTTNQTGEQLFATHCASCHGPGAIGENPAHRNGGMKTEGGYWAPALNGTAHAWHHSDAVLFRIIKEGSIAEDSPMRGFQHQLSDEDILKVIQYFKSLWPEEIRQRHANLNN